MTEKFTQHLKSIVVVCARYFSDSAAKCYRTALSILTFIGFITCSLIFFSAMDKKYTFTFDYDPFVFSIEPMDQVELKFREADQTRQAEKLARK